MTDKQIIKQLAERYKEICRSPFADGYTFIAFDSECAKKGFTRDDIKNYIEKEKQERKAKRTESIKSLKEQLKAKEQECEELKEKYLELKEQNGSNIVQLNTVNEQLDQLKAYNKQLEKENLQYRNHFAMQYMSIAVDGKEVYCGPVKRLEKTLQEIKEIAEKYKNLNFGEQQYCYSEVLRKINECGVK